jgi:hypothetical protein
VGSEPLDIGGTRLAARHLRVSAAGQPDRDLWVDASGRVLKLTVSASGFEATRTAAPG